MEQAVAIGPTRLMSWTHEEIEETVKLRPKLALALLQLMAGRLVEFANRIDSFSRESTEQRLRRTLVRFAGRFGSESRDGTVKMDAFTHEILSQYVGTSREIVSHYMNRFKGEGYLQYSRQEISLQPHALTAWQTAQSASPTRSFISPNLGFQFAGALFLLTSLQNIGAHPVAGRAGRSVRSASAARCGRRGRPYQRRKRLCRYMKRDLRVRVPQ
jgi:hypothetical protein